MTRYTRYDEATRPLILLGLGALALELLLGEHAGGAGPMIFDVPLLLFLAPVVALARRLRRVARSAAAGSAWPGAGRRRWPSWRGRAAAGRRCSSGLVALLAMVGLAGPRVGRTEITHRDPRAEPGLRGGHQPLDAGGGRRAQPAAARRSERRGV